MKKRRLESMINVGDVLNAIIMALALLYAIDLARDGKLQLPHQTIPLEEIYKKTKAFLNKYFPLEV